jgi:hypothetical protein
MDWPQIMVRGPIETMRVKPNVDDLKHLGQLGTARRLGKQRMEAMIRRRVFGPPPTKIALGKSRQAALKSIDAPLVRLSGGATRSQAFKDLTHLNQFNKLSSRRSCQIDPATGFDTNHSVPPKLMQSEPQRRFTDTQVARQRSLENSSSRLKTSRLNVSVQELIDLVGDAVLIELRHVPSVKFQTSDLRPTLTTCQWPFPSMPLNTVPQLRRTHGPDR